MTRTYLQAIIQVTWLLKKSLCSIKYNFFEEKKLFPKHSPEVIPYPIFLKFSPFF